MAQLLSVFSCLLELKFEGFSLTFCSCGQAAERGSISMDAKMVGTGTGDAISGLPDDVLCHILSFLSTKHAASTSVLSNRWRDLFVSVPNLDFDDSVFLSPQDGKREREGMLRCFMDFVDRALTLQGDLPIKKFSLKCRDGVDPARVNRWICNVLDRGVLDLDLYISLGGMYSLPSEVFTSKTLIKLKIGTGFDLAGLPLDVCFPMLKTLFLDSVGFGDDGTAFKRLLSGCIVLEELVIDDVEWEAWNGFCSISVATLKRLTIYYKGFSIFGRGEFSLDTPNLVYLEYSDLVAHEYPTVNLDSLVEARLDLQLTDEQILYERATNNQWLEDDEHDLILRPPCDATDLIKGISNIQILYLSPDALEVLSMCCEAMPVFNNLIHLSIESDKDRGWQSLPVLLKNSPNLETLVFEGLLHYITDGCGDACICIPRKNMSYCLSSSPVKRLEISGFEGTFRELKIIEHFLEKLLCLEQMIIYAEVDDDKLSDVTKDLLMLPGASSKCRIQVM